MAPKQKPGRSKQSYQTPAEFLLAVLAYLQIQNFDLDAAAEDDNAVATEYYTVRTSALLRSWQRPGWTWCNPPFAHLEPWVKKAWEESKRGAQIAMLVPAGVGANWWRDWVHEKAQVLLLKGRITFVGETAPYPKDTCLLLYGGEEFPRYKVWTWTKGPDAST
jgi:site-specific DNA-methyltransferase (adenine-specific)